MAEVAGIKRWTKKTMEMMKMRQMMKFRLPFCIMFRAGKPIKRMKHTLMYLVLNDYCTQNLDIQILKITATWKLSETTLKRPLRGAKLKTNDFTAVRFYLINF